MKEEIAIRAPVSNLLLCDPKVYVIRDPSARTVTSRLLLCFQYN